MKILLLSSNIVDTPYFIYPLGLGMVAAALRNAGHEVIQFDFLKNNQSLEELSRVINKNSPDVIGVSIRNIDNVNFLNEQHYIHIVKNIVQKIRQNTDKLVVLGGSGFSLMPELILREVGADYGIVGEGESTFVDFVNNVAVGILPKQRCIRSSLKLTGENIPSALYDSGLMEFYLNRGSVASIQTKRGCNYGCVYCSYPLLEGSVIRPRSPEAVVDDIQFLMNEHKAKYIFFTDSVFNDNQGYYLDVLNQMEKRRVCIPWTAFFRPDLFDEEQLALMKKTGLKAAEIGADASTDVTLACLKKSFSFKDVIDCNNLLIEHGIASAHYYMFGCPGETKETVLKGIENIKSLKDTVSFIFMGIRIFPNTILAEIAQRESLISTDQDFLKPVYYIAPGIDKGWLEDTLVEGFRGIRNCIFPPDSLDSSLQFLHSLGYYGSMLEMFIARERNRGRSRRHAEK